MEDNVENPVQSVFDAPVGADGISEGFGVEFGGRKIVTPLVLAFSIAFDQGFDHSDHLQAGETRLFWISSVGKQPFYVMTDGMMADFDPTMVIVGGFHGL